jgi:hypothetical protein
MLIETADFLCHRYADVVKFGDKHQNKHVGDHSYTCTVEESGALHNKNNEKSIIPILILNRVINRIV